jgi:AGCS family alanine or glycine:cation symporter
MVIMSDNIQLLNEVLKAFNDFVWGPYVLVPLSLLAIFFTIYFHNVQFRYFLKSWKLALGSSSSASTNQDAEKSITVFQAFINSLGASIGNGNIAGIPMAIYLGGPGAIFWMLVMGFLLLSLRFAEVYLGTYYSNETSKDENQKSVNLGGPMAYLSKIPGGRFWPGIYAFFCFLYTLTAGNAVQCNSIAVSITTSWTVPVIYLGIGLTLFVLYILTGGAKRIIEFSFKIVPLKVGLFLICSFIILVFHLDQILPALALIVKSAFTPVALASGTGYVAIQEALKYGTSFGVNASEVGVGTAAVIFGQTEKQDPVEKGIVSMLGAFITTHIICFIVGLTVIVSGVWNCGAQSSALTIAAYETVFGAGASWIVTTYTLTFGLSVVISYAYISRQCWFFLSNSRFPLLFAAIYALATLWGSMGGAQLVWNTVTFILSIMLFLNILGMIWLSPLVRKGLDQYRFKKSA